MRSTTFSILSAGLAYAVLFGCGPAAGPRATTVTATSDTLVLSRTAYRDRLEGFWLGQCIGNWTGLITEMDKIGGAGQDGRAAGFYTRADWGQPDQPNLWNSPLAKPSPTIDFVFEEPGGVWGADDDTDIEYIYQALLDRHATTRLTAEQIRDGWLRHIYADDNTPFREAGHPDRPENYLWVSNQTAHDLMRKGVLPPQTSDPARNPHYAMIDAQLTTEIFGLFAPTRPDVALELAYLPIRTTARYEAAWIAEFYVIMHALAATIEPGTAPRDAVFALAQQARQRLPADSYAAGMYDFVLAQYRSGVPWEAARDALHQRYQVEQAEGYDWSTRDLACNGCFAAGINFGASIVSLLYGGGDLKETIKIGTLAGWDSDNPTATWAGLLGFLLGKEGVEQAFGRQFADRFNIHRTRGGFANDGIDTFSAMAERGLRIVDRVERQELGGRVDTSEQEWHLPRVRSQISVAPYGTITFISSRGGNPDIFTVDAEGLSPVRITEHPAVDYHASWSPDGSQLLFNSNRGGNQDIYVLHTATARLQPLTDDPADDVLPAWSPDGSRILFASNRNGEQRHIYVMDRDGGNVRQLTDYPHYEESPAWSPDGSSVLFTRQLRTEGDTSHAANGELFITDLAGGTPRRVTQKPGFDSGGQFAPDGKRIAFYGAENELWNIYLIDPDGSNLENLTADSTECYSPFWSPDGNWIAYVAGTAENYEIWIINVHTRERRRITDSPGRDESPTWSPLIPISSFE